MGSLSLLRQLPNAITLLRIAMVIPLAMFLARGNYHDGFLLFFIAAVSDALDGLLAKRFDWTSRFGAIADPIADKLLMVTSYFMLATNGELPLWLFVLVVLRDLVIVCGALLYHRLFGPFDMAPTRLSKLNTLLQILLVVVLVFSLGWWPLSRAIIDALIVAVAISTAASGLDYVWRWGRRAVRLGRQRRGGAGRGDVTDLK